MIMTDRFTPDPGTVEEVSCGICGEPMDVKRNVVDARSYVESISGSKFTHDVFICPHRQKTWHQQAKELMRLARKTPSSYLQAIYQNEAEQVLKSREPTKTEWE